ncbi:MULTISPECIES: adenylate kinase [Micromonospora]|uniref:Adenylate kinase n=1 Tax=Micromonospora solifontis TaxID=2487138 RepID=A0ABX9WP64_9ACTN|nr:MULTISPECIES: adenylate kinase [Micromonospora]NES12763.1 adenylate kinase [Micromonospora sp. PPF5-17B]NES34950.1 adenylate kinase [Micromonospora solifontis]NES54688.1 adenylate kinase [Micromonospora sp. PPF5-6]RNM01512.1 adenylate kinase [Micromonospora solifontis]
MRRILVVGSSGAGKSTLARELARRLDLPLIHLDRHYWRPGWTAPAEADFRAEVTALAARPAWVMDGNYASTLDLRLPRADLLILCDPPRLRCLARVLRRRWAGRATPRPDLPPGCPEQLDLQFLRYLWSYPRRSRPRVLTAAATIAPDLPVVRLRTPADTRRFLATLPTPPP